MKETNTARVTPLPVQHRPAHGGGKTIREMLVAAIMDANPTLNRAEAEAELQARERRA